jgi:hypothetical protein
MLARGQARKGLAAGPQLHVEHVVVKDDDAVVELRSQATAINGLRFDNRYCMVLTYVDSALAAESNRVSRLCVRVGESGSHRFVEAAAATAAVSTSGLPSVVAKGSSSTSAVAQPKGRRRTGSKDAFGGHVPRRPDKDFGTSRFKGN